MTAGAERTEVLAYYFPQYHPDPRNDGLRGKGWTEWELVKAAGPRFPGHRQPIVPAWGCFDESDPDWAGREIALAADHGITGFLFDWYHYEDGPFLGDALDRGFLRAPDNGRLKFALMWANHDWEDIHPDRAGIPRKTLFPGRVSPAGFERIARLVVREYMGRPNYLSVGGEPFFSIYDLGTFVEGLGGLAAVREAIAGFRAEARSAGLPGIHLNAVDWGDHPDARRSILESGFSSVGSYTWIHHYDMREFPRDDYRRAAEANYAHWEAQRRSFPIPFFPNVTMGWDSSPRTERTAPWENRGYPWLPVLEGNTPRAFGDALRRAREFVSSMPAGARVVTVNAWNEWTEGSYLLPDTVTGTAYLEEIRKAFGALP